MKTGISVWYFRILILAFFLSYVSTTSGQSHELNNLKYWHYRTRLKQNFMQIGPAQGQSLIASARGGGHGSNIEQLYFGDQTILLGEYIAVLALEYHMLARDNQSTDSTVEELFYALYALNRLDMNAESLFHEDFDGEPNPQDGDLNGFFIRDDVDYEFYNSAFSHLTSGNVKSKAKLLNHPRRILSDWISDKNRSYETLYDKGGDSEMSQDQVHYLMLGLAMIQKFIPNKVVYANKIFQDGEEGILEESTRIIKRIVGRINSTHNSGSLWSNFLVTNPARENQLTKRGGSIGQGPTDFGLPVVNGLWSFGFAEYCCKIQGSRKRWFEIANIACDYSSQPDSTVYCHNKFSRYAMRLVWLVQELSGLPYAFTHDNRHQFALLLALKGFPNIYPIHLRAYKENDLQHIPLIRQVLYGGINPIPKKWYRKLLDAAPFEGPYKFVWKPGTLEHNASTYEWSGADRIVHSSQRGNAGGITGEFPGLDYMLYHNLYYTINENEYYPAYR